MTLDRMIPLLDSGEIAEIVVVDNASSDGTADAVRRRHPGVRVLVQERNLGAVGRTVGARATLSPVIAFADDDSWWEPGALPRAAELFAAHARLGLVHARLLVAPGGEVDDACLRMTTGPVDPGLPGPSIMGHLGCAVIVRREAFLEVGGYSPILGFGGEEALLALDLAVHGWKQCYVDSVVAYHAPSARREGWPERWARYRRNDTLTALLRLPASHAARETLGLLREAARERVVRRELLAFMCRLPAVARQRRRVPPEVWRRWQVARAA